MLSAVVVGNTTSTVKHSSLDGCKLLLCQILDAEGGPAGTPIIAIDLFGAGVGQKVFVSTDGIGARGILDDDKSPARMFIQGLVDETVGA